MRRVSRVLIPAALLCTFGLGVLAFQGELKIPQFDIASLLSWGAVTEQGEAPVASKAIHADAGPIVASAERPSSSGTTSQAASDAAGKAPASTLGPQAPLKIDFARIDGGGVSVIGGRAPAGSRVSIHANGEVVAIVTASEDGQWSGIVTRAFEAGPLSLSVTSDSASLTNTESPTITLQVPEGSGHVELAAAAPKARPILPSPPPTAESRAVNEFAAMVERARTTSAQGESAKPEANIVPVPITFVTGEATMSPEGIRAAHLLTEYVRIVKPHTITLSGHADVRGGDNYNFDLSRRRLEAIDAFLRKSGYTGELSLLPRGKTEPYQGIDRKTASIQEIYQADRRVELRFAE